MKRFIIFLLFVFMVLIGRSQSGSADPKQLFLLLAQSKPDTNRIGILIRIAESYFDKGTLANRMDSVEFFLKKAGQLNNGFHVAKFQNRINYLYAARDCKLHPSEDHHNLFLPLIDSCKKTGDKATEAMALLLMGVWTQNDSASTTLSITCYQKARELARQLNDDYTEMRALGLIASVHINQQKFDLAERELFDVLKEEKKAGPKVVMFTCYCLTDLYIRKGEYDKGLQYALKTQKMLAVSGDSSDAGEFYMQLSIIYRFLGKTNESREWAKKNLDHKISNLMAGDYRNICNIAGALKQQGKSQEGLAFLLKQVDKQKPQEINDQRIVQKALGDIYRDLKMYDQAEKSYVEMIRLGNQQTRGFPIWDRGYDNCNMGSFYYQRGRYQKALPFLETALKNYEAYGGPPYLRVVHIWLFKTDSALGDYMGAIQHLKESNRLGDSIFNITRNKQIEELQVVYKTEQNAKDFRLLQGKEQLGQVRLQNTKNTRNWTIAGASLLLIIAALLFRLASLRKKNNGIVKNKNELLQHLVTEKEWLLKEVHHRVKNNLHTVIGLLESQAANLQDDALKANEISKHRIYAMSLIHQQLYNTEDIKTIDMAVYLPELLDYLAESFGTGRKIRFRLDIATLKLGVSQAIPIGLIVNEAVTNSIKYAFLQGKYGNISISMHHGAGRIKLVVEDDGIGMDPAITNAASTSMGLKLMKGLSRDIDGEINFTNENGTRIEVNFKPDPLNEISTLSKYN